MVQIAESARDAGTKAVTVIAISYGEVPFRVKIGGCRIVESPLYVRASDVPAVVSLEQGGVRIERRRNAAPVARGVPSVDMLDGKLLNVVTVNQRPSSAVAFPLAAGDSDVFDPRDEEKPRAVWVTILERMRKVNARAGSSRHVVDLKVDGIRICAAHQNNVLPGSNPCSVRHRD